jgi:hypothetical protein
LGEHLRGLADGARRLPGVLALRRRAGAPPVGLMEAAVPPRPWRGPRAGGHPEAPE